MQIKKNWKLNDTVMPDDLNRIEGNIEEAGSSADSGKEAVEILKNEVNQKITTTESELTEKVETTKSKFEGKTKELAKRIDAHSEKSVVSEEGVHGLRYFDDEIQIKGSKGWSSIETGGGIAPYDVINAKVKVGNQKLTISWGDPDNTVVDGHTICIWKGTKLVQKVGSYPENVKDGILLVDNQEKDKYKNSGFEIPNLVNGQTYYLGLFPYSDKRSVNLNMKNRLKAAPRPFRIMTVKIDLNNSNPATCCTYADDASEMLVGSAEWDDFFGHYPCLFKNGQEVGKLKRDNFSQFEDGKSADITSGDAGDVMVAFPRRGVKIGTTGDIVTVSMTDDPDHPEFKYYAHTRVSQRKEKFYLGAYKGWKDELNKLRSLSGKTIINSQKIGAVRTQAQANGAGYEMSAFFQLTFRQVMYLLKYRNLNSQATIGRGYGYQHNRSAINTGGSETYGMDSEIIKKTNSSYMVSNSYHVKLFGLEDFWGNIDEWIDGFIIDSSRNVFTTTGAYNDTGSGYDNGGNIGKPRLSEFMSKPNGTTELGFTIKEGNASTTTYFCDMGYLGSNAIPMYGGNYCEEQPSGIFKFWAFYSSTNTNVFVGSRLMYL